MSPSPLQWDAYDPLTDNLYCRVQGSNDDGTSTQTRSTDETDEVAVRRYEDVARRYLSGYAPVLITSTLRGPFDRASGFVNPWAKPIRSSQSVQQSTSRPLRKTHSPALCEPASTQRLEATQATESSYLPSPESLNPDTHPFLERDDIVRVERWRSKVQRSDPSGDELWTSTSQSQSQSQSAKRPRADSSWLRRRPDKRRRTLEPEAKLSSPVSIGNQEPQRGASSPPSSLTSLNDELTPALHSSQPKTGVRARHDESTVADASHDATFSSSERLSRRASQGSRLPPGSEARARPEESMVADSHDATFSSARQLSRRASRGSRLPSGSGIRANPEESMVADSHDATFSSSQRPSRRPSQGSRLPPSSEAPRRDVSRDIPSRIAHGSSPQSERRPLPSSKPAVSETSRRRSTSVRRSTLAAEPENIHISSDDSTSTSSSHESNHEEALEDDQDPVEVGDGPAVHPESDHDVEAQDIAQPSTPQKDGARQAADPNVTPKNASTGLNPVEVALLSASKLDHHGVWRKHIDGDVKWQSRVRGGKEYRSLVRTPPVARSLSRNALDVGDSPDRHQRDKTAVEHCDDESESATPAPTPVGADIPTSSATDYASTTLVEGGEDAGTEDVQAPHEDTTPTKPAAVDPYAIYTSSPSKTDTTTSSQEGMQPHEDEPRSTPQPNRHTQNARPNTLLNLDAAPSGTQRSRVAAEEQSPWMKSSVRVLAKDESKLQSPWMKNAIRTPGNNKSGAQSPWAKSSLNYLLNHEPKKQSPLHITSPDQPTQSSIVSPEAQSPWTNRPATQCRVVDDTFSSSYPSPQLPPPSEETQEEPRATEAAERSTLSDNVSNADFSIRSFSSFMFANPNPRPTPRKSDSYLPRTPSLLAAATENPWDTATKPKKRVSWAPLPRDASSPAPLSSFNRASPPPAEPIPDDVEEDSGVFGSHFVAVKRRTDPVRQRLLPPPSQLSQRSPETDAMAAAFVTAESSNGSSPVKALERGEERDESRDTSAGEGEGDRDEEEGPVDDVDDVLANLNEFLTTWDVETDLQRARDESRVSTGDSSAGFRGIVDMEVGGW